MACSKATKRTFINIKAHELTHSHPLSTWFFILRNTFWMLLLDWKWVTVACKLVTAGYLQEHYGTVLGSCKNVCWACPGLYHNKCCIVWMTEIIGCTKAAQIHTKKQIMTVIFAWNVWVLGRAEVFYTPAPRHMWLIQWFRAYLERHTSFYCPCPILQLFPEDSDHSEHGTLTDGGLFFSSSLFL